MQRKVVLLLPLMWCLPAVAQAAFSIDVGTHVFTVNTGLQTIPIFVNSTVNGDPIAGVDFVAQIGDGGVTIGGVDVGPSMTGDIIGPGTLFELDHGDVHDVSPSPMLTDIGTTTGIGFVFVPFGSSLLGTLTIDTTAAPIGSWPLLMSNTADGDTDFALIFFADSITNGTLIIVASVTPEPSSIVLGLFGVAAGLARTLGALGWRG